MEGDGKAGGGNSHLVRGWRGRVRGRLRWSWGQAPTTSLLTLLSPLDQSQLEAPADHGYIWLDALFNFYFVCENPMDGWTHRQPI